MPRLPFAALLALALPGPCTTFDGVAPPEASDAGEADAAVGAGDAGSGGGGGCDAGVRFAFVEDAGCQEAADRNCCIFEVECAANDTCVKWVACVNACATPRLSACVNKCGSTASFTNALTGLSSCRTAFDGGASCSWP